MIAVETVIRKLISEYEFVIIPGFGALLSHQVPAIYDQESGIFAPPVKKLAFNEFLKLDDGLLANFISREEKITHVDAVSYVRKYTDILRSSLKLEGHTIIEGIGEFKMNIEGKLQFEPNTEKYFKDEWFGFKSIIARNFELKTDLEPQVSEIHAKEEHSEIVELLQGKKQNINWIPWASAAMIAGLMFYFSFFLVSSNKENFKSTLNPFSDLFESKSSAEHSVVKPDIKQSVVNPVEVRKEVLADSISVKAQPLALTVKKDSVISEVILPETGKDFYLIAGAFNGMKQAKVLLAELQAKGFDKAVIIPSDKYSKKVKVAVDGYVGEKEAYSASANLKTVIGEKGWVFKKR